MNDDQLMYVLEAIAYISATVAAFVYVWETCSPRRKRLKQFRSNTSIVNEDKLLNHSNSSNSSNNRRSSSSLYDNF